MQPPPDFSQVTSDIFTLAPLTDHLPIIETPEGNFVPLRALCEIVGLAPATYIGVFCQRFKELEAVRRLPWETPAGKRKEWCLHQKYLPMWLMAVLPDRVPPDRREALMALRWQCAGGFSHVYTQMQQRQRAVREEVFGVLGLCERVEKQFARWFANGVIYFPQESHDELIRRLKEGNRLVDALAASARRTLAAILAGPVADGLVIGDDGVVKDTVPFPLLPVVQSMEPEATALLKQFNQWLDQFVQWWDRQIGLANIDFEKEL